MTLIEVVAGLALLASLLVGILLARARYVRQSAEAERRLRAVAAADALLSLWHQSPRELPRDGLGSLQGDAPFAWRTRRMDHPEFAALGAEVIRLEVFDASQPNAILASVEIAVEPEANRAGDEQPQRLDSRRSRSGTGQSTRSRSHAPSVHHP